MEGYTASFNLSYLPPKCSGCPLPQEGYVCRERHRGFILRFRTKNATKTSGMLPLIQEILDLIYPRSCHGCRVSNPTASPYLCWNCFADISFIQPPFCSVCGDPVAGYIDHDYVCSGCHGEAPHFDQARSCAYLRGVLREMIHTLKYNGGSWLIPDLGQILAAGAKVLFDLHRIDSVMFVPLYPRKERERGFNQAELLARLLAKTIGKRVEGRCLRRVKMTPSQTSLTASKRIINVRGSFVARRIPRLDGQNVLLVDDVMTTGATLNECARVLKRVGVAGVYAITVGRG